MCANSLPVPQGAREDRGVEADGEGEACGVEWEAHAESEEG